MPGRKRRLHRHDPGAHIGVFFERFVFQELESLTVARAVRQWHQGSAAEIFWLRSTTLLTSNRVVAT
jgi:hypothetical protein